MGYTGIWIIRLTSSRVQGASLEGWARVLKAGQGTTRDREAGLSKNRREERERDQGEWEGGRATRAQGEERAGAGVWRGAESSPASQVATVGQAAAELGSKYKGTMNKIK